jgi:hypothetical protein
MESEKSEINTNSSCLSNELLSANVEPGLSSIVANENANNRLFIISNTFL